MIRQITILVVCVFLATPYAAKAQSPASNIPYIYYFSDKLQAFVIERADGTDSHILGKGLMRDVSHVEGPGWSPSGKWFAWTAQELAKTESQSVLWERSFLIRSDGAYHSTLIDNITSPMMQWSPHDDILLVTSQRPNYDANNQYSGIRTWLMLNTSAKGGKLGKRSVRQETSHDSYEWMYLVPQLSEVEGECQYPSHPSP